VFESPAESEVDEEPMAGGAAAEPQALLVPTELPDR